MEALGTHRVVRIGTIALMYTLITLLMLPLSFGSFQLRLAEMLMVLCLFSKDSVAAVTIGCFAANVFGPYGAPDVILGTAATFISGLTIYLLRKHIGTVGAAALTALINAPIITAALYLCGETDNLIERAGFIASGELLAVAVAGSILRFHIMRIRKVRSFFIDPENEPQPRTKDAHGKQQKKPAQSRA